MICLQMSHVSSYNIAVGLCSALSDSPMGVGAVTTLHSRPLFAGVSPRRIPFPPTNGAFHFPLSFLSCPKLRSFSRTIRAVERSGQANSDGSNHGKIFNSVNTLSLTKALSNFVVSNFLPIALISGVALGITNPTLGCIAHRYSLSTVSTFGIFIISGLKLQGGEIGAVAEAWPALVFGLVSILLLSPFFSKIILQIQLAPQEFVTGLAIFSCMPTTLSSGVALTQLVCGNAALALAMTVMSNLLGILIVPFWISRFLANDFGASIPTEKLLWSLTFTLLVPLVLGKVLRSCFQGLATYVDQNRRIFSIASTILLSLTPWMQVSKSGALLLMVNPVVFLEAIGMGILGHIILLGFNAIALQSLSAIFGRESVFGKKENARALLVVSSQFACVLESTAYCSSSSGAAWWCTW